MRGRQAGSQAGSNVGGCQRVCYEAGPSSRAAVHASYSSRCRCSGVRIGAVDFCSCCWCSGGLVCLCLAMGRCAEALVPGRGLVVLSA